jgi:hypothetical protein
MHMQRLRSDALARNGGRRSFARWKQAALEEVLGLAERSPRMSLLRVDLATDFEMTYRIAMPVPRVPRGDELVVSDSAVFHLVFREEWRDEPPPGWAPLGILDPLDIWHPNYRPSFRGAICLGRLPAGIPPKELVLLGYFVVSLQDYALNEFDPHGVLNGAACEYYRCHPQYLPLTRTGLFESWNPRGVDS